MSDMSGNSKSHRRDSALAVGTVIPPDETILDPADDVSGEAQESRRSVVRPILDDAQHVSIARLLNPNRGDQIFLGIMAILALGLMAVQWTQLSGWGVQPIEIEHIPSRQYDYRIDINSAEWIEWVQMQGIGETLANRIVDDRDQNGPFESIDDLQRVKGIGPKTVEKLRPWIRVVSGEE